VDLADRQVYILCLSSVTANLWKQEINTEWSVLVDQKALELVDLLTEHLWGVSDTTNNTETTGIGNGSCELWTSSNIHTRKQDWMLDLEEIRDGSFDLFC
jgi:hypothetical protein